jgi:hypothetical protein
MEADLIADYGEFYGLLFDRIAMESILRINPPSKERLLRRIMQKILDTRRIQDEQQQQQQQQADKTKKKKKKTTFTFITAGDSRAAAHGNIFTQSYTSVIDVSIISFFQKTKKAKRIAIWLKLTSKKLLPIFMLKKTGHRQGRFRSFRYQISGKKLCHGWICFWT